MQVIKSMNKKNYFIIGGLIIVIIILMWIVRVITNRPQPISEVEPSPLNIPTPTAVQISIINNIAPTLPTEIKDELRYPVDYEEITVEYKPDSGTFLVYYNGDKTIAEESFNEFFSRFGLNKDEFTIKFRSLEPISLPPVIN